MEPFPPLPNGLKPAFATLNLILQFDTTRLIWGNFWGFPINLRMTKRNADWLYLTIDSAVVREQGAITASAMPCTIFLSAGTMVASTPPRAGRAASPSPLTK